MKIYLRIIIFVNILLIGIIILYPYFLDRTYYSIEYIENFYNKGDTQKVDTLFLGDSTVAFGIRPNLIQNARSLALPGSTNINVLFELNRYLRHFPAPKCVAYSTAYIRSHFYENFLEKHMSANAFTWDEIKQFYADAKLGNVAPASEMTRFEYLLRAFYLKYINVTINTQIKIKEKILPFLKEVKFYRQNREYTIKEKGHLNSHGNADRLFFTDRQNYLLSPFTPIDFDDYYFNQILKLTSEKNIKFIFVEMPLLDLKIKKMDLFNLLHLQHIEEQISKYQNAKSIHLKIKSSPEKFYDANHLNSIGATEFTKLIKTNIEKECSNR